MKSSDSRAEPLISCVAITWGRFARFKNTVEQYVWQTWPNKELVIVQGDDDPRVRELVEGMNRPDIRLHRSSGVPTIPRLRNEAISYARGELLCQWDDDDLCHPLRLERQARHLLAEGAEASMFGDHLHYFEGTRELFWADWGKPYGSGLPGTLMCFRTLGIRYQEEYLVKSDGVLERELRSRAKVTYLRGEGYLYTYVFHGQNVWDLAHHRKIAEGLSFEKEWLLEHLGELKRYISAYPHLPRMITCGSGEQLLME